MGEVTAWPVPGTQDVVGRKMPLRVWLIRLFGAWAVLAFVLGFVARFTAFDVMYVPTMSMARTIDVGDRVVVDRTAYWRGSPDHGDIVTHTLKSPEFGTFGDRTVVKRVVAVGGETISCCDTSGRVRVDGRSLDETYVFEDDKHPFGPVAVPDGHVFLMGDHRSRSSDSRQTGPVPESALEGKVVAVTGNLAVTAAWPFAAGAAAAAVLVGLAAIPLAIRRRHA